MEVTVIVTVEAEEGFRPWPWAAGMVENMLELTAMRFVNVGFRVDKVEE